MAESIALAIGKKRGLQSLADYITDHYEGNQSAFARSQGVKRQQITQWLKARLIVFDNGLYAKRRQLKPPR